MKLHILIVIGVILLVYLGTGTFRFNTAIRLHNERNGTNLKQRTITSQDRWDVIRQTTGTTLLLGTAGVVLMVIRRVKRS